MIKSALPDFMISRVSFFSLVFILPVNNTVQIPASFVY